MRRDFAAIRSSSLASASRLDKDGRQCQARGPIQDHGLRPTREHRARNARQALASPTRIPLRTSPEGPSRTSGSCLCAEAKGNIRPWLLLARPYLSKGAAAFEQSRLLERENQQEQKERREKRKGSSGRRLGHLHCLGVRDPSSRTAETALAPLSGQPTLVTRPTTLSTFVANSAKCLNRGDPSAADLASGIVDNTSTPLALVAGSAGGP